MNTINLTVVIGENVTITGNVLTTTLTDEQVREARGVFPQVDDRYWYLGTCGGVDCSQWQNDILDTGRQAIGNVFPTEAEAIRERDVRLATQRVRTWIKDNGMEFVPNWKDEDQLKWIIYYSHSNGYFSDVYCEDAQYVGVPFYFATLLHAQACIDACGDDLRIIAGVEQC